MDNIVLPVVNPDGSISSLKTFTNISELFDPRKNSFLRTVDLSTHAKQKKFFKEFWNNNSQVLFAQFAANGEFAKKWIETFKNTIPSEDWYLLSMLGGVGFSSGLADFSHGSEYLDTSKSHIIEPKVKEFFNKVKASERKASATGNFLGYIGSFVAWLTNNYHTSGGRKNYTLSDLRSLSESTSYSLDITASNLSNGLLTINTFKVNIMLSYEDRNKLYKNYSYSTKIFDVVGNRDSWLDKGEGNVPLYGVELEVSTDYTQQAIIDAFPEIFAFIKDDSTISGSKMYSGEIVTIPASLRKHKKMWAAFFKSLSVDMFDHLDKHTNGMHVHIDRKTFDDDTLHLKKFCYFFTNPINHKFLIEISERDKTGLDSYAALVPAEISSKKTPKYAHSDRLLRSKGRKLALNLSNSATVEVRLFKGIVSFASIVKNLEFCEALVEFSREHKFNDMNISTFLKWLKFLPASAFRTLRLCLEDMDFETMLLESEIEAVVRNKALTKEQIVHTLNERYADKKLVKMVVKTFNDTYEKGGVRITFDDDKYILIRQQTKFSKFNDKVLGFYYRN